MSKTDEIICKHIASVQLKLEKIKLELENRCRNHDASKLQEPEHSMWERVDREPRYPYGSKEYQEKMDRNWFVFDQHYKNNTHHPEHFTNGVYDMDLVDIIEMLCDWISYKKNISYNEAKDTIEKQSKRFHLDDQLCSILKNTLMNYFVSLGGDDGQEENYIQELKNKLHTNF